MVYTEKERALLNEWPTVTAQDLERMNDLFQHYLFYRRDGDLMGLGGIKLWASCCGHKEVRPYLTRTQDREHWTLMDLSHKDRLKCPWCGREVTAIDLSKAKERKSLRQYELAVILHAQGDVLYADALCLRKEYADEDALTARPEAWCSSGYRFGRGEVMQADYQVTYRDNEPYITYERDKLARKKLVQEPFKVGPIYWYHHEPYFILNREAMDDTFFRYCGYFDRWQYRPGGARGYAAKFEDFISYLTAYAIYPRQVEMLVKCGLSEPVSDLIYARKKNRASMCWEEPDPRKSFGLNKRDLNWFLGVQPPMDVLAVRNYVRRHWGKEWGIDFCYDFYNLWGSHQAPMEVLRFLNRCHLDPNRFLSYMDRIFMETEECYYADLFETYRDYLFAAYQLGYCMGHSHVLWPEDLFAAHDKAAEELTYKLKMDGRKRKAASMKERRLKYEFELDGLRITFPATGKAIRREGKSLEHCVGGYAERHLNGTCTILFLRRSDRPGVPYVTIEMDGDRIKQIHGYRNERTPCADNPLQVSPKELHREFLAIWLRWLKNGSKRNDDGTPKLPRHCKSKDEQTVRYA